MNTFTKNFSDEELTRDWTLSFTDIKQIGTITKSYQLYVGLQICAIRLHGNFLDSIQTLSPRVINYLNYQLDLPAEVFADEPVRRATRSDYHGQILTYLDFRKYDKRIEKELEE